MSEKDLRVRVGASLDASYQSVMASTVSMAKRAKAQVVSEAVKAASDEIKTEAKKASEITKIEMGLSRFLGKMRNDASKVSEKQAADEKKIANKSADDRIRAEQRAADYIARIRQRSTEMHATAAGRAAVKAVRDDARARESRAENVNRGLSRGSALAIRAGGAALGFAGRFAMSAMHGMGYQTDVGSLMHDSLHRETMAVDLANQGYIGSGKGPAGSEKYANSADLMDESRKVGNKTGNSTEDVLGGMTKFTRMTGDLQTARDSVEEIGKIAKANGADLNDMMEAAASVSIAMGDIPDKAQHLASLMRTIAGQGHLGAVTIKDMASQMGKLTGQANFFKMDPRSAMTLQQAGVTNDTAQRIAVMGAMTQWARAKGGRISAQQATQSSMAMIADMSSPAALKKMNAAGINVFADEGHTKTRDPLQIIGEVFKKARAKGGVSIDTATALFPQKQSRAVVKAMAQDYDAAYAKAAQQGLTTETEKHKFAMESLTETFQNYLRVTQSNEEVQMKFNAMMATGETRAKIFNNEMGKVADGLREALLPAVEGLSGAFLLLATDGVDFLTKLFGIDTGDQKSDYRKVRPMYDSTESLHKLNQTADDQAARGDKGVRPEITKRQHEQSKSAVEDMRKAIEKKAGRIAEIGSHSAGLLATGDQKMGELTDDELRDKSKWANVGARAGRDAEQLLKEKSEMAEMEKALTGMSQELEKLEVGIKKGTVLEVIIKEDHSKHEPGDNTDGQGTAHPDAHTD